MLEPKTIITASLSPEILERLRPDSNSELPMVRQLYLRLYECITQGILPYGHRLPASREMASQLSIARNTVVAVYQQLTDEQLLESQGRRGTKICYRAETLNPVPQGRWLQSKRSLSLGRMIPHDLPFTTGQPDTNLFPTQAWRQALKRASEMSSELLGYQAGPLKELQDGIARYLAVYRSLHVQPEQILITSSTRQSLLLAASLFADQGDTAWVETPGYPGAVDAFRQQGLELVPCHVDAQGAGVPDGVAPPKLVYLTPCFQYPLGPTLGATRRKQFLDMSSQHGTVLFEDDYDTEFRDDQVPRPALAASNLPVCVLNAGTFSKLMFPAVRVAWLVLPPSHVEAGYRGLKALGGCDNSVNQFAVAELLNNGTISQHLKRARQVYARRRAVLLDCVSSASELELGPRSGSLCVVVGLKRPVPTTALIKTLDATGLGAIPLERLEWHRKRPARNCSNLVLGLGNVASLEIPPAVRALDNAVQAAGRI